MFIEKMSYTPDIKERSQKMKRISWQIMHSLV